MSFFDSKFGVWVLGFWGLGSGFLGLLTRGGHAGCGAWGGFAARAQTAAFLEMESRLTLLLIRCLPTELKQPVLENMNQQTIQVWSS